MFSLNNVQPNIHSSRRRLRCMMFSADVKLGAVALTFDAEECAQLARICRSAPASEDPGAYHFTRVFELAAYLISFANEFPFSAFEQILKHVGDLLKELVPDHTAEG